MVRASLVGRDGDGQLARDGLALEALDIVLALGFKISFEALNCRAARGTAFRQVEQFLLRQLPCPLCCCYDPTPKLVHLQPSINA